MTIDKIGGIGGSGYEPKRTTPVKKTESKETFDNVSISDTAKQKLPKQNYKRKFKL